MKIRKVKVIRIPCRKRKSVVSENQEFILKWFNHVVDASNEGRDILDDMVEAWRNSAKKEVN